MTGVPVRGPHAPSPKEQFATDWLRQQATKAQAARPALIKLARQDPALFTQLVLRRERDGGAIKLSPTQLAWHDLITRLDRVVIWSHVEAGKTQNISVARVLYELGRDPSLRILILSNTHAQASRIIGALASYIEHSETLHQVFPHLTPTKRKTEPWKPLSGQLTIARPTFSKDASITASGIHGAILGARYDLVIVDDILSYENCRTQDGRKQTVEWMQSTVHGRITAQGRMIVIGTAFHPEDALHHYAKSFSEMANEQRAFRYPVIDDSGNPRWPDVWPIERIEKKKAELGSLEFSRQMLCVARDDSTSRFQRQWIDTALALGRNREMAYALQKVPNGYATYTGVDLAVQQHSAADLTVLTTIIQHPNGQREILAIESGRWTGPDIVDRIVDHHRRYSSVVTVENNAAQEFIVQYAKGAGVPVRGFTTGRNKAHPEYGVEHLAVELEGGQWIFPNKGGINRELDALINELLYYDPRAHTGDRLMSLWLAREGSRAGQRRVEVGRLDLMTR